MGPDLVGLGQAAVAADIGVEDGSELLPDVLFRHALDPRRNDVEKAYRPFESRSIEVSKVNVKSPLHGVFLVIELEHRDAILLGMTLADEDPE